MISNINPNINSATAGAGELVLKTFILFLSAVLRSMLSKPTPKREITLRFGSLFITSLEYVSVPAIIPSASYADSIISSGDNLRRVEFSV